MDNEVGVTSPESTTQTLPSFEEYTPLVTYPEEVENSLGTPIEVKPLNETKLEEVGLNCNHNTPLSSREVPSFDGPEPQPLLNSPSLDVSLGDVMSPEPPIKPHSPDTSRMKVVDYLTTQTPPSPHVANSHPKVVYSYYNPGIAEDVLVEVVEHVYPIDFMILDIKEDEKRPFILGTPFLTTAKAASTGMGRKDKTSPEKGDEVRPMEEQKLQKQASHSY
ncbi:hypothetical protein Tco_0444673 [Tanacetum coccineum]